MNRQRRIRSCILVTGVILPAAFCWFGGGMRLSTHAATTVPTTAPAFKPAFTAMSYYDTNCAHCHGPQGSNYGATLGNDLSDDALIKKCKAMEVGPGGGAIGDDDNVAVTAYHRALIMQVPFVSITQKNGNHLEGEVTPDATVTVTSSGKTATASVSDWEWTIDLPEAAGESITVKATVNGKTASFDTKSAVYSSSEPLPPKETRRHG